MAVAAGRWVEWDKATPTEVQDLVLWFKQAAKPRTAARTTSVATAGRVNPVTRPLAASRPAAVKVSGRCF
ncbi:hypothetical protein Atai01_82920 [Amycolatopsis taiwanensis]|uniref:Uncharacterized protein n=1 Tax=Amycolatopsis taiwanensis TaxID=342230 RepID=A0A9W6R9E4_9PSEU|nr:hypothetical protein Atai01_82920 [Amycolatopsis taiwanensis]